MGRKALSAEEKAAREIERAEIERGKVNFQTATAGDGKEKVYAYSFPFGMKLQFDAEGTGIFTATARTVEDAKHCARAASILCGKDDNFSHEILLGSLMARGIQCGKDFRPLAEMALPVFKVGGVELQAKDAETAKNLALPILAKDAEKMTAWVVNDKMAVTKVRDGQKIAPVNLSERLAHIKPETKDETEAAA